MTELGASPSMVFATKLAVRLHMDIDNVFDMPLAKALAIDNALQVLDGTKPASISISEEDKEIVKYLSENQEKAIEKFKEMRRF